MDVGKVREIFLKIKENVPGIREVLVITEDGFPVVSTLEAGDEEVRYTAGGAILCDAGQRGVDELGLGGLEAVVTVGSEGYFVLAPVTDETVMMIIASSDVALGMVLMKLRKTLPIIREIFRGH
jgi:predicted regulator of Ras-like GTPase activity (Roadblock/LC7/MglB family)